MNMQFARFALFLVLTAALTRPAPAQQTYRVVRTSAGLQLVGPGGQIAPVRVHAQNGVVLVFQCDQTASPAINCTTLSASLPALAAGSMDSFTPVNPTAGEAHITIPAGKSGNLTVRIGNSPAQPTIPLTSGGGGGGVQVVRRFEVECAATARLRHGYDQEKDTATFVVAADGFVIGRPSLPVDENDVVHVHVVGNPEVLRTLKVERTSTIRGVGQVSFVGDDVVGTIRRHALDESCGVASTSVTDFAPGEGVVTLTTVNADGQPVMGRVTLRVNPVYHGAFSFGPVLSHLEDRTYGVLADSTITQTSIGEQRGEYLLTYTHFVWEPRDVEKSTFGLRNFNPMIGISLEKPLESVFVGGAFDLLRGSLFVVGGAHGGEVTRLDPSADLQVGDKLPSGFDRVPTREEWQWEWFYGVTVDLRAAVKLFGSVLTGGQN